MGAPYRLNPAWGDSTFPDPSLALSEPNGLLAVGGDLSPNRILNAYRNGIFPWFSEGEPILWWSPAPRAVIFPKEIKVSKSLKKTIRKGIYQITLDRAFDEVVERCSQPRIIDGDVEDGTWITDEMKQAYIDLHMHGFAHSVEAWFEGELVGGLYGISMGKVFFGESMFTRKTDASKVAFVVLVNQLIEWGFELIDCQVASNHLSRFGAVDIPRKQFMDYLDQYAEPIDSHQGIWSLHQQKAQSGGVD
ncbi:MAG: leucyl/phenylalanyl-tRNA--protein transferase [Chromatiales bacterium]|nr:leucyl/phenylalanyl-tRNA--protein transferase [Chromatiales bacterium]